MVSGKAPFRRVIATHIVRNDIWKDLLDCGHLLPEARDLDDVAEPQRRRCRKCGLGQPVEVEIGTGWGGQVTWTFLSDMVSSEERKAE